MLRTFNCGYGMAAFVSSEREAEAKDALERAGLSPLLIGRLVEFGRTARHDAWAAGAVTVRIPTAILISGRGSNMKALIAAALSRTTLRTSRLSCPTSLRRRGSRSLANRAVAAEAIDFRSFPGRPVVRGGARFTPSSRGSGAYLPCRVHARLERGYSSGGGRGEFSTSTHRSCRTYGAFIPMSAPSRRGAPNTGARCTMSQPSSTPVRSSRRRECPFFLATTPTVWRPAFLSRSIGSIRWR